MRRLQKRAAFSMFAITALLLTGCVDDTPQPNKSANNTTGSAEATPETTGPAGTAGSITTNTKEETSAEATNDTLTADEDVISRDPEIMPDEPSDGDILTNTATDELASNSQGGELGLTANTSFYTEPGTCDKFHSKSFYCDGYAQRYVPSAPSGANQTPETEASVTPPPNSTFLQLVGEEFNASLPSIVYIHGWNMEGPDKVYAFPNQWARQVNLAGYNIFAFNWAGLSYDSGARCAGLGFVGSMNVPCNAAHQIYKSGTVTDKFLAEYRERFTGYNQKVRLVAHSMGSQLAILATYRMYKRADFANVRKPSRVDLIDPFMTPGLGGNRDKPFDGQIPSDGNLAPDYRANIVTNFKSGSKCHSWSISLFWWKLNPANHLSQYCQNEGMAYSLVKDYNVAMIDFSAVLGGMMAADFKRIMLFQSFGPPAFKGNFTSQHLSPNASYFYSFSTGTPPNGYDASSPDEQILADSRKQAIDNINMSRRQTSGFDTITFRDDGFR